MESGILFRPPKLLLLTLLSYRLVSSYKITICIFSVNLCPVAIDVKQLNTKLNTLTGLILGSMILIVYSSVVSTIDHYFI